MPLFRIVALVAALPLLAAGQFVGAGLLDSVGDSDVLRTPGFNGKIGLPRTRNSPPAPAGGILSTPSPRTRRPSVLRPPSLLKLRWPEGFVGEMILAMPRRSPRTRSNRSRSCLMEPDETAAAK